MPLAVFPKCFIKSICDTGAMSVEQWIDMSAALDVDGLEFFWPFTPWEDEARLEQYRQRVERQRRRIAMMGYASDYTQPDRAARRKEIEEHKRAIRATAALGGGYCRVLTGQRHPGVRRNDGIAWVVECIQEIIPFAEANRIVLTLENHYKSTYWTYPDFALTGDVFLEVLDKIPESPWFGVNYDPSNTLIAGEDPIALLDAVKHRVKTMHASDRHLEGGSFEDLKALDADPHTGYAGLLKHGVIGQGMNDYDRIFTILKQAGFSGWISIEDGIDPATGFQNLVNSALFLRRKMQEHGLP